MEKVIIQKGWRVDESLTVAKLYEEAFGSKFSRAIPDRQKRIEVLSQSFRMEFSFVARIDHEVVGLAGFHTPEGSLTGDMSLKTLTSELGLLKGMWQLWF